MPASYCPSDCGVQNILADVVPDNDRGRKFNEYMPPTGVPSDEVATSPPKCVGISHWSNCLRVINERSFQGQIHSYKRRWLWGRSGEGVCSVRTENEEENDQKAHENETPSALIFTTSKNGHSSAINFFIRTIKHAVINGNFW